MPRTKTHPSQLGKVVNIDNKFCARFQPREFGQARDFTGPSHDNEKRATEDLTAIRSAGAKHATRMGALEAMREEAKRLKDQSRTEGGAYRHLLKSRGKRFNQCLGKVRLNKPGCRGPEGLEQ